MARRELFPLDKGLASRLEGQLADLIAGHDASLLSEVTPVTAQLLRYWFEADYSELRELNFHAGQRRAIPHIIYAHEVLKTRRLRDLYQEVAPDALLQGGLLGEVTKPRHEHPKYAAKMATGSGKTWVLNALLIWQYLNKSALPDDERFTSNFLLVSPGGLFITRVGRIRAQ